VSDFQPLDNVHTRILYAVNRKKRKSDRPTKAEKGPLQIFETIEPGSVFEGVINIEKPIRTASIKMPIEKKLSSRQFSGTTRKYTIKKCRS